MSANLTTKAIKAFKYRGDGASVDIRWDAAVPGLGVRIYPSGRKAFVLKYRAGGEIRTRMMVLGQFGVDMTLSEARDEAGQKKREARKGQDPLEERRRRAQGETFADLKRKYLDDYAKPNKKSWKEDERRLKLHIPKAWNGRKVRAINDQDVASLHAEIGREHPVEANRVASLLHTMFTQARKWGFVDKAAPNPAADIDLFPERSRERWLQPEELPALAQAIDQEPNIYIRSALWLYLLTGARKSELLNARRRDLDVERGVLRLPETKAGKEQLLSLSAPALAILQATPALEGNPYLLPSTRKKGGHLVNLKVAWRKVRDRASVRRWAEDADPSVSGLVANLSRQLERTPARAEVEETASAANIELKPALLDLRIHDLRRSVGSWMTQSGVDLNLIKDALRHQHIATTLTYARLGRDPARAAFEAHGKRVLELAGKARPRGVATGG